jgi:hypothetical protein
MGIFLSAYAASLPLNPQMSHAEGSRQLSQTLFLSISSGSLMMIALMVWVIGLPMAHAILLNVADADAFSSGV